MKLNRRLAGGLTALALIAGPAAALASTPAATDTLEHMTPSQWDQHDIQVKDGVVGAVRQVYRSDVSPRADQRSARQVAENDLLREGHELPAGLAAQPLPAKLASVMPAPDAGARWATVGDSIVMIGPDGTVLHTILDVMP